MKLRTAIATATTAAVLATSGVALAGAASSGASPKPATPTAPVAAPAAAPAAAPGPASAIFGARRAARLKVRRLIRRGAVKIITQAIGIDAQTLRADLRSGQTIAQIATSKGVLPQTVITDLVTAATTKLNAAVTAHKISQARATKIEAALPAKVGKLVNTWLPKAAKKTAA